MYSITQRNKGITAILLLALFSVLMGVVVRELSDSFTLFQQIYLRLFTAFLIGLFVFPGILNLRSLKKIPQKDWQLAAFRALIGFVVGAPLWVSGFSQAKLANAVLIDSIPMSALLGFIILKEPVSMVKFALLFLSFVGAAIIAVKDFRNLGGVGIGEILVFCSIIFFALRNVLRRFHTSSVSNAQLTQLMHLFGTVFLFGLSLLAGESFSSISWTARIILFTILGGALNVGILFTTNFGFSHLDAVSAGNLQLIAVVFGVVLGTILYAEVPTLREIAGGVLIVVSVITMNRYAYTPIINNDK